MPRARRLVLTAVAGALVAAAPAPAATDGTSNTIMFARSGPVQSCSLSFVAIEFKNPSFMDYTDDACDGLSAR